MLNEFRVLLAGLTWSVSASKSKGLSKVQPPSSALTMGTLPLKYIGAIGTVVYMTMATLEFVAYLTVIGAG